jgi:opacity protein-like surface antigen
MVGATIGKRPVSRLAPRVSGTPIETRITTMMRKFAAALIAASLIAGPVLAQAPGSVGTTNAPAATGQPVVKADTAKTDVKVKKTELKAGKTKKHVSMNFHHRKHVKYVKHVKHVKYAKNGKHHVKQVKQPTKNKIEG